MFRTNWKMKYFLSENLKLLALILDGYDENPFRHAFEGKKYMARLLNEEYCSNYKCFSSHSHSIDDSFEKNINWKSGEKLWRRSCASIIWHLANGWTFFEFVPSCKKKMACTFQHPRQLNTSSNSIYNENCVWPVYEMSIFDELKNGWSKDPLKLKPTSIKRPIVCQNFVNMANNDGNMLSHMLSGRYMNLQRHICLLYGTSATIMHTLFHSHSALYLFHFLFIDQL